jgi:two-component system sensor histidine kinase DegS
MRNQLEQLDSRRESIVEQHEKLRILLNLAEINREKGTEVLGDSRTKVLQGTRSIQPGDHDYAADLIRAQERERVRVARQLTDGPAQVLANLILRTEVIQRVTERNPASISTELTELRSLTAESLLDIRRSILELRPLPLDELGLVPTLRRYVNDFARETGSTITVNGSERDDSIASHTRVALFRLIQLALAAVVVPGVGTQVVVDVRFEDAQLMVRIDATSIDRKTPQTVERFVSDEYTADTIELIGANFQREVIANGIRLTVVVPLGLA